MASTQTNKEVTIACPPATNTQLLPPFTTLNFSVLNIISIHRNTLIIITLLHEKNIKYVKSVATWGIKEAIAPLASACTCTLYNSLLLIK